MTQTPGGSSAPVLVVVRAAGGVGERTADSIASARGPADRVVVAHPNGHVAPARAVGRGLQADHVADDEVLPIMEEHAAAGGVVVLLHDGAYGFGRRWLSDLAAAPERDGLDAALTASNAAPFPVSPPDLPDAGAPRDTWRDFTKGLAGRPTVVVDDPHELVGPAVVLAPAAVRALRAAPVVPPLEVAEIARSVAASGLRVGRADRTYVHDEYTHVLLSACLIMKDEADNLRRCLGSLRGVADEVVVYDTGSTDGSVELARSLGATVIEGHWDDDFARARNAARRACRGTWLLHVDADEEVEDPPVARDIRGLLLQGLPVDLFAVPLHNLSGTELAPVRNPTATWVPRLVHRTRCRWHGALHEHPLLVTGGGQPRTGQADQVVLLHYGYLDEAVERRDKWGRNARIAATKMDDARDRGRVHFERGRSLAVAGRYEEAVPEYRLAADTVQNAVLRRAALELGAQALLNLGRADEAGDLIERRAAIAEKPGVARWLRAQQRFRSGDVEGCLAELDGIADFVDNYSTTTPDIVLTLVAEAHLRLGHLSAAGDAVVQALTGNPLNDRVWAIALRHAPEWPDTMARAARTVPADSLKLVVARLLGVRADLAALAAEHLWDAHPNAPALLAYAAKAAGGFELEDAARWAVRLRAAGHAAHCPLRTIADEVQAPLVLRLQAAYLGAELFDDDELRARQQELTDALARA